MKQTWRIDPIGRGRIAWLYVIPHACDWSEIATALQRKYEITEERQNLVDPEMGGCLRYLTVARHTWSVGSTHRAAGA